jgi:hypothetical protein
MTGTLPERDWKYLRSIEKELLDELCRRINQRAVEIVQSETGTGHEKYQMLYKHIEASDRIVGDCFDDWRRSTLTMKLLFLSRHKLLASEQMSKLSDEARQFLHRCDA